MSMENNFSMDQGSIHGINKEVPEIGLKFDSEELAYDYYNHYARNIGFSIRKDLTNHRKETKPAGKKSIKTKRVTGKRKRNAQHEPAMEKEITKKKTTQIKMVTNDGKTKKTQNAEVIYSDSDVEEFPLSGFMPSSALEVDKNGVSASLLGSSNLQQRSTPLIPYYCPQLHVEDPIILEGEGTHNVVENVQSNQSFLTLMLE